MENADALSLEGLSMSFGGLRVLSNINLNIRAGERRAVVGPNGAGKTTLFHLISGELMPTAGKIRLMGQDVTALPSFRRAAMGLGRTFQKNNLFAGLTVLQNAVLAVQVHRGISARIWTPAAVVRRIAAEAEGILERVGLAARAGEAVGLLSYGEQRQLEIGLALASEPEILLLDEPTAGMSAAETERAAEMIRRLPADLTLIIIEHDMDVIATLAETMTVLHFGEILADGTVEEAKRDPLVLQVYLGSEEEVALA